MLQFDIDAKDLSKPFEDVNDKLRSVGITTACTVIVAEVGKLTKSGKDFEENPFEKYSERWKAVRQAAQKQTGHVDFIFTGDMMRSLGDYNGLVTVGDAYQDQAEGLNNGVSSNNLPSRKFLGGVSQSTADKIADAIGEELNK